MHLLLNYLFKRFVQVRSVGESLNHLIKRGNANPSINDQMKFYQVTPLIICSRDLLKVLIKLPRDLFKSAHLSSSELSLY